MLSLRVQACARVRVLSRLVPRCDTVDSDSSRAVVPEMFHVAPLGFVLHCLAPCAVGCALLYVPIHGRTQTVIVGVQWGHRADFSPPLRSFPFFYRPCRTCMHTSAGTSLRCCVTRWIVIVVMQLFPNIS